MMGEVLEAREPTVTGDKGSKLEVVD